MESGPGDHSSFLCAGFVRPLTRLLSASRKGLLRGLRGTAVECGMEARARVGVVGGGTAVCVRGWLERGARDPARPGTLLFLSSQASATRTESRWSRPAPSGGWRS